MSAAEAAALMPAGDEQSFLAATPAHQIMYGIYGNSASGSREGVSALPERMSGAEFLRTYGGHGDGVTEIEPDRSYAVRAPTGHPVFENFRVLNFEQLLAAPDSDGQLACMGELMYAGSMQYHMVMVR
jgi:hypothetical protein